MEFYYIIYIPIVSNCLNKLKKFWNCLLTFGGIQAFIFQCLYQYGIPQSATANCSSQFPSCNPSLASRDHFKTNSHWNSFVTHSFSVTNSFHILLWATLCNYSPVLWIQRHFLFKHSCHVNRGHMIQTSRLYKDLQTFTRSWAPLEIQYLGHESMRLHSKSWESRRRHDSWEVWLILFLFYDYWVGSSADLPRKKIFTRMYKW